MSILTKINEIEWERTEEKKAQRERAKVGQKIRNENLSSVFKKFSDGVMELNGKKVAGHKITIKPYKSDSAPKQKMLQMIVDGKSHVYFYVEEKATYCNCSDCREGGSCGDPGPSYSYFIRIKPAAITNEEYLSFESLCEYEIDDEEKFSHSVLRLIDDYENREDL